MIKGVFFSSDPGGTNALIPIAREIHKRAGFKTQIFASSFAIPLWQSSRLPFTPVSESITEDEVETLLMSETPDYLFTGTSERPVLESTFWNAAERLGIFTYSIIDHWTRYRERYIIGDRLRQTDIIFTIDDNAKEQMTSVGFDEKRIIVSGQPHFQKFYAYKSERTQLQFCSDCNLPRKRIITFISDNISRSFPSPAAKPSLGFDEHLIVTALLKELQAIPWVENDYQLIIKLHPKEPLDNFSEITSGTNLPVTVIKEFDNMELIFHSDFVIGMFSMLLFEAFIMKKPVLSVQLHATEEIHFGEHKIPAVVEPARLRETLENFFMNNLEQGRFPYMPSVERIVDAICSRHGK